MAQPNWHLKHWNTGQPMTLAQAFGFGSFKLTFPKINPQLPSASGQANRPLQVQGTVSPQQGKTPHNAPKAQGPIHQYAKKLLAQNNWTGAGQWNAFVQLENSEAGWNPRIKNPKSGALGIAQALGHSGPNGDGTGDTAATQGSLGNEYGGYGLTNKQAKEANSGNGYWQLVWMMNYIKQVYGSPMNAWSFHQANNYY
jgi:hypothetical protein